MAYNINYYNLVRMISQSCMAMAIRAVGHVVDILQSENEELPRLMSEAIGVNK